MRRALLMIVPLMLIGCNDDNKGGGAYSTTPPDISSVKRPTAISNYHEKDKNVVKMDLDSLSFSEAFRIQHLTKGEGHTFWWHGNEYTTDLLGYVEDK